MDRLIETVRNHPCLWDTKALEYKNHEMKEAAWCEIVKECALLDVQEARSLWRNLRDGHRQAVSRKRTSGCTTKWRYEDQMNFLLPTMTQRRKRLRRSLEPYRKISKTSPKSEESVSGEQKNEDCDQSFTTEYVTTDYEPEKSKIMIERESLFLEESLPDQAIDSSNSTSKDVSNNNKALELFFESMFKTTNKFPELLQLRVQRQVFQIVMEAQEKHLLGGSHSVFSTESTHTIRGLSAQNPL